MGHTGMRPVGPPNRRLVCHSTIVWLTTATANITVTTIMPHRGSHVGSLHSPLHIHYQPKQQAAHWPPHVRHLDPLQAGTATEGQKGSCLLSSTKRRKLKIPSEFSCDCPTSPTDFLCSTENLRNWSLTVVPVRPSSHGEQLNGYAKYVHQFYRMYLLSSHR